MKDLFKNIIKDIRTELLDEFDQNFQRKAFFDQSWPKNKFPNSKGSQMSRSGRLRRGMRATISGDQIIFTNSQPYAELQNNGGTIIVTPRMKKFFWAMYYQASGGASGTKGKKQRDLSAEAEMWKRMALKKVGDKITIEARQFIGWHPEVKRAIEKIFNEHLKELEKYMNERFKIKRRWKD